MVDLAPRLRRPAHRRRVHAHLPRSRGVAPAPGPPAGQPAHVRGRARCSSPRALVTGSDDPFLLFLGLATFYGYYHVVRQHYGFVALYNARNRDRDPRSVALDKWTLYVGCWAPYAYFLLTHPKARALLRLPLRARGAGREPSRPRARRRSGCSSLRRVRRGARATATDSACATRSRPTCWSRSLLYGFIYFVIARFEPVYAASTGPDQDFLLLSIVIVIFHNVQYLGPRLVPQPQPLRRRRRTTALAQRRQPRAGAFLAACALFSLAVYLTFACCDRRVSGVSVVRRRAVSARVSWNQIGLCLWWGLAHEPLLPRSEDLADARRRCAEAQPAPRVS